MSESFEQRIHAHMRNTKWEFTTRFVGLGMGGKPYVRIRVRMDTNEDIETQLREVISEVQTIEGLAIGDYGNSLPYVEYSDANPLNHGSSLETDVHAVIECRGTLPKTEAKPSSKSEATELTIEDESVLIKDLTFEQLVKMTR